jgi:hypothetical protein
LLISLGDFSLFNINRILRNGIKFTHFIASAALDALGHIQIMRLGSGPSNRSCGTGSHAALAARAFLGNNAIDDYIFGDMSTIFFALDCVVLQRIYRHHEFTFCLATTPYARFYRFQHVGCIVASTTLRAYTSGHIFQQNILSPHLPMQRYPLFDNRSATVFTGFTFPETHHFSFYPFDLSS